MPDPIKPHQPVPGKPIPSLPTPVVSDKIYTEVIDSWQGKYEILPYGTAFNSVEHGAFPKDLPDHILVFDGLQDASGQYRRRVWVSNRVDEDTYNYEITYDGGDPSYPIYVRSYVVKRDEYAPATALTPDSVDSAALLVSERTMNELEPQELFGQYIKVVKIFKTLPGIIYTAVVINERGDTETTVSQDVVPGTSPTADALLVTKSQVTDNDEANFATKTTGTVPSYSQLETRSIGGLGLIPERFRANVQVEETNDVIAAGTNPDAISGNLVESIVADKSATKADKTNRSLDLSSLQTLTGKESTTTYGGGILTVTETPVAAGTAPDEGYLVTESSVTPWGIGGKALKVTKSVSSWPTLVDFEYDQRTGAFINVQKTVVAASPTPTPSLSSNIQTEYKPLDTWRSIQIVSKFDTTVVGTSKTYKSSARYSFPAWVTGINFVTAYASDMDRLAVALNVDLVPGPSGSFASTLTESFVSDPTSNDTPFQYKEMAGTISLAYFHGITTSPRLIDATSWTIPASLHTAITPSLGSFTNVTETVEGIDASDPSSPNNGNTINVDCGMEYWRFGVYVKSVITMVVPSWT